MWYKVQELGLTNTYKTIREFRTFCRVLNALAFLPLEDVNNGMRTLRDIAPQDAEDLTDYFDYTYVSGGYRQRRNRNRI